MEKYQKTAVAYVSLRGTPHWHFIAAKQPNSDAAPQQNARPDREGSA